MINYLEVEIMTQLGIAALMILLLSVLDFIAWLIVHFCCEFKYYWCKGKCDTCYNWKCKFFGSGHKD